MSDIPFKLQKIRDGLAREFCKDWPTEVIAPPDMALFYERGFNAGIREVLDHAERLSACLNHVSLIIENSEYEEIATKKVLLLNSVIDPVLINWQEFLGKKS